MRARSYLRRAAGALLLIGALGCGASGSGTPVDPVLAARQAAEDSTDGEVLGKWLLMELVASGGSTQQARSARTKLDGVAREQRGLYASIARGFDDEAHGSMIAAAKSYLAALEAARTHEGPEAELLGWYVTSRLMWLRPTVAGLWKLAEPGVEKAIADPGRLGFRARTDLVDWWLYESRLRRGTTSAKELQAEAEQRFGCIEVARFSGPFGRPAPLDIVTSFDAEKPGAWPTIFTPDPSRKADPPITVDAERGEGICALEEGDAVQEKVGVHYVETFIEIDRPQDVILSVRAAWSLLVDDVEVMSHDPRSFGTWTQSTVALRLKAGRHRIVGRLGGSNTFIRILDRTGHPLPGLKASADPSAPYSLAKPVVLPDPSALAPFVGSAGVATQRGWPAPASADKLVDANDPVLRFIAADLAHVEGNDDVATVLVEPLVKEPSRAAPITLAQAAMFIESDPIFPPNDARDLALDYRKRATSNDARLWYPQLWLLMDSASKQGDKDILAPLAQLANDFSEVSVIGKALANAYARVGYQAEQRRVIDDLAKRFPDDVELLRLLLSIYDEDGRRDDAEKIALHIEALEPESTIRIERAIARNDLEGAAQLLQAQAEQAEGTTRKRLLRRFADLLVRSGKRRETLDALEAALAADPKNARTNLDLADARLAAGDHAALRSALAHALRVGSDAADLREAIETVDRASELEPFRMSAKQAIDEFESSGAAKQGLENQKGGTAARVLDYAALWVHADGSARMLEHEILFMQSSEAIREHAEQRLPRGKLLTMRVVKANGRTLEPEIVANKPTATMPHLEVGDYIETETIYDIPSEEHGIGGGQHFLSPRWFFREEKVDYHRSEFIVITPSARAIVVEKTGNVPDPIIETRGPFTIRRWRVDKAPALPNERFSAPASEFLPSVRAGWGITQADTLARYLDASTRLAPSDPRLVRIAKGIATDGIPEAQQDAALAKVPPVERARRIYRWVLDNVEPTRESDPRKSIIGKSGSRLEAFLYLTRLVGVDARHALVQDRTHPAPTGPFAEAEMFTDVAVAIPTGKEGDDVWTVIGERYAPFGYMPSSLRGQPAVILRPGLPRITTGTGGPPDGVAHKGKIVLSSDGSARLTIDQSYTGRLAIILRDLIQNVPDQDKLKAVIEGDLLRNALPGARVISFEFKAVTDLDAPLVLHLELEVSAFAQKQRGVLVFAAPFVTAHGLAPFTTLPRRETPLLFPPGASIRVDVDVSVELPANAKATPPAATQGENDGRSYRVADRLDGKTYSVVRALDIPAGRVTPDAYPEFVTFARAADEALHRDIVLEVP